MSDDEIVRRFNAAQLEHMERSIAAMATLRDQFAMAALGGMTAGPAFDAVFQGEPQSIAKMAYACADAMMAEREKRQP